MVLLDPDTTRMPMRTEQFEDGARRTDRQRAGRASISRKKHATSEVRASPCAAGKVGRQRHSRIAHGGTLAADAPKSVRKTGLHFQLFLSLGPLLVPLRRQRQQLRALALQSSFKPTTPSAQGAKRRQRRRALLRTSVPPRKQQGHL